jgi:hypothetical protein
METAPIAPKRWPKEISRQVGPPCSGLEGDREVLVSATGHKLDHHRFVLGPFSVTESIELPPRLVAA